MTAKKSGGKGAKAKKQQVNREVAGICFIALGLFFAVSIYSDAVGTVGAAISSFFFGLCGVVCYVLPVLIFILGIAVIATSKKKGIRSAYVFGALGVLCVMVILHAFYRGSVSNLTVLQYYKEAYQLGEESRMGAGVLGALLAYPSLKWLGAVGTYIFFAAGTLVMFLLVTRISLKSAAEKVGKTIKSGVDSMTEYVHADRQQGLYTEDLQGREEAPVPPARRRAEKRKKSVFIEVEDGIKEATHSGRDAAGEPELLPASGRIDRRSASAVPDIFDEDYQVEQGQPVPPLKPEEKLTRISRNAPEYETEVRASLREKPGAKPAGDPYIVKKSAIANESSAGIVPGGEKSGAEAAVMEYQRPPTTLLNPPAPIKRSSGQTPEERGKLLVDTLASFNIAARLINISVGPAITRYELQPAQGVRVNRITTLSNDIALALAASHVRIEAPIPGKAAIGIEVPNVNTTGVTLREIIESSEFAATKSPIAFAIGKDIAGKVLTADLNKMPHLMIAGTTGSGKSVCNNCIILSMIYKTAPKDLRMILVDPKQVEFMVYAPLPHLLLPVVTDPKKAASALKWAVAEMGRRYQKMSAFNARELNRYNALQTEESERMPRLVVVIDELADLMMVAAKEVEESICRIAQLGRAAGIHLILSTQRPTTDIITGLIKANVPSRIGLMVSSAVDSRVILDTSGAEKLVGNGDMLFHPNGASKPIRAQGAFVSDEEIERVMDFFAAQQTPEAMAESTSLMEEIASGAIENGAKNEKPEDEMLGEAVKAALDSGQASTSLLQRRLRVGYARAGRLIDIMEQHGFISGPDGSKPRKLLIGYAEYDRIFGNMTGPENTDE